jgi:hypothetical protein
MTWFRSVPSMNRFMELALRRALSHFTLSGRSYTGSASSGRTACLNAHPKAAVCRGRLGVKMSRILRQSCQTHMVLFGRWCARSLDAHPPSRASRGTCPYLGCCQITSRGSDLHPPAAPRGERYALSREERAGTHRISRLLKERTIPAICIGLRRFCNVIAPPRGRITRIQCRQVGMSSATDKEACNRNERARNQATLHQRTPCNHSIHVHGPLGNNVPDPVQSTEPDQ